MKNILAVIMFVAIATAAGGEEPMYTQGGTTAPLPCVPESEAIAAWSEALTSGQGNRIVVTTTELTPCHLSYSSSACYEYMARQERSKEEKHKSALYLLGRAKQYGICK